MNEELKIRFFGIESIIHSIYHNLQLMNYINKNLHKERFNLHNNLGLYWIWSNLIASQLLDFYKLITSKEKFSFSKIINIAKGLKYEVDFELLENETQKLVDLYDKTDYETVRSKYLAHQDLNVPEIRTDFHELNVFSGKAMDLFVLFSKIFNRRMTEFNDEVVNSFSEIFDTIDEYEEVKGLLIARLIQGNKKIDISEIQDIVDKEVN